MTSPLDLDWLEGLARAATKGPWEVVEHGFGFGHFLVCEDAPGKLRPICATEEDSPDREANAAFIAALNPETVLQLISAARGMGGGDRGGWALVPREPAEAMARAYAEQMGTDFVIGFRSAYRAMIAAAPPPPEPLEEVVEAMAVFLRLTGFTPFRIVETADYAEIHAANSSDQTAFALTTSPSFFEELNRIAGLASGGNEP